MNTSHRAYLLALALSTGSALPCFGFAEFARGPILLSTSLTGTYDSHFIGGSTAAIENEGDYYTTLAPTLTYSRNAGRGTIDVSAGLSINRYDRNSSNDSEDFNTNASISLPVVPGSRINGSFTIGYNEGTSVDELVNDRIASKSFSTSLGLRYQLGLKMGLSESLSFNDSWRGGGYSDQKKFSNTLGYTYNDFLGETALHLGHGYTRTLSSGDNQLGADLNQDTQSFTAGLSRPLYGAIIGTATYGYQFMNRSAAETTARQTQNDGGFFSLGLDGPFLPPARFPKLKSSLSLSYQQPTSAGINDTGGKTLTGAISLSWNARERTSISLNANREVELSVSDYSVETTQVGLGVTEKIGQSTSLNAHLSYNWSTYRGVDRKDNRLTASLSASRQLTKNWSLSANYTFSQNQNESSALIPGSRLAGRDYTRHLVSISGNFTF